MNNWLFAACAALMLATTIGIARAQVARPDGTVVPCGGAEFVKGDGSCATAVAGGSPVPAGVIVLIISGSCPSGFVQETALDGRFVLGTVTANGDIGTTGGSDSITSVLNHSHGVTVTDPQHNHLQAAHTHTLPVGATDDTAAPFDRADAGTNASGANATTASGSTTATNVAAATGISATTANPAGSVASIDNRPAFTRVIFCRAT